VSRFRLGLQMFVNDMHHSLSLFVTFVIAILAFILAIAVATGFQFVH
jgi:hypothetical protein